MSLMKTMSALVMVGLLYACGSGSSTSATNGADTTPPVLTKLTTTSTASGVTLAALGTDNVGITGYCFKMTTAMPLATDSCFQASNQKALVLTLPLPANYVWAKDAAGNVSATPLTGPCSKLGFVASDASALPTVCMMTAMGEMVFELNNVKAPITTANFLKYVSDGFYTDTVFHRIISNFMVQGGGFTYSAATNALTSKAPTYASIALEAPTATGLSNTTGTIAMARTNVLNSATSQFFVNVVPNTFLDTNGGGYAVFGQLIAGTDTLAALKASPVVLNGAGELSQPSTPPAVQWAIRLK